MNRRHFTAGLTLVEMLIVLVILAIAGVIVVPMMGDDSSGQLRAASQVLVADLEFVQLHSIGDSTAAPVMVFEADGGGYQIAAPSDPVTPLTDPATRGPYVAIFGSGRMRQCPDVTITGLSVGGDDVLGFESHGGLDQTAAASLTLLCSGRQLVITIEPYTGEASVGAIQ